MRQEGKSILTAFSAMVLAQQDKKVVIIDANLRHPSINNFFNLPRKAGLYDYLSGDIKTKEIISSTSVNNLDVITSSSVHIANPQRYLDSDKFSELIKALTVNYDVILIDTPAFINGSDTLIISKLTDDVIFIVEQGKTPQRKAQKFMDALKTVKIKMPMVVLNKVKYL
jgi:capsular exopolysaccharide synthesis family protein